MERTDEIHPDLVKIALDRVTGTRFEDFGQPFWSALACASYVPLGGMHDGGADGFHRLVSNSTSHQRSAELSSGCENSAGIRESLRI